jgi:hypothetical protein
MLATALSSINPVLLGVAVAQFPTYGFLICRARSWKRRTLWALAIASAHLIAAVTCFAYV